MMRLRRYCGVFFLATALVGCVRFYRAAPNTADLQTQAVLAASDARQINMFGDLPDGTSPSYFARASISLRRHTFGDVGRDSDPDIDSSGDRLVFSSTRHHRHPEIYVKSVDGIAVTQLTSDPASDIQPTFSPDGRRIAFASDRAGSWDIWIMDLQGGSPIQVTSDDAEEVHPSWSADGSQIAYCSLSVISGQWELWLADATVRAGKRFIGYGLFPEWSPVGDTIAYQRAREQGSRWFSIWAITLVNGEPGYPTELAASAKEALILPSWSPDGRRIAYTSSGGIPGLSMRDSSMAEHGPFDIWVMNADGSGNVRATDGATRNFAPTFAPNGRVFFTTDRTGHDNVWSLVPSSLESGFSSGERVTSRMRPGEGPKGSAIVRTTAFTDGS